MTDLDQLKTDALTRIENAPDAAALEVLRIYQSDGVVAEAARRVRTARTALSEHRARVEAARREAEFLRHAVEELGSLDPQPGEEAALAERRASLPKDPEVALGTGRVALARGGDELAAKAGSDAGRARGGEGGPALAEACAVAAWAEWGRGRADRAARELRKALSADPDRPDLRAALVEALAAPGQGSAAKAAAAQVDLSALQTAVVSPVRAAFALLAAAAERAFLPYAAAHPAPPAR